MLAGPVAGTGGVSTFFVPSGITLKASLPLTNWALAVVAAGAAIELAFAVLGIVKHRHWMRRSDSTKPMPLRDAV